MVKYMKNNKLYENNRKYDGSGPSVYIHATTRSQALDKAHLTEFPCFYQWLSLFWNNKYIRPDGADRKEKHPKPGYLQPFLEGLMRLINLIPELNRGTI